MNKDLETAQVRNGWTERAAIAVSVVAWGIIFWTAYFVQAESYDGYEYLLTARTLLGESTVFAPKNASFTAGLAVLSWLAKPLGWDQDLRYFHLALSAAALISLLALSRVISRAFFAKNSWAVIFALFTLNRTVMAFAPSALSDVAAAIVCAWWWFVDASWGAGTRAIRPRGQMVAALALVLLGRINAVFFPFFTQAFRWVRGQSRRAWLIAWSAAFAIYVVASALFNLAGNFDVAGKPWYFKFLRGIIGNHDYLRVYARMVRNHPRISYGGLAQALLAHFGYVGLALLVVGIVRFGVAVAADKSGQGARRFVPSAFGAAIFFVATVLSRNDDPMRLFAPLIVVWVFWQMAGLGFLRTKSAAIPAVVLALMLAEQTAAIFPALKNRIPQCEAQREAAVKIGVWAEARKVFLAPGGFGAIYAKEKGEHDYDPGFYNELGGRYAFEFFTKKTLYPLSQDFSFGRFGYPIIDRFESLIREGDVVIFAPVRTGERVSPLYAVRWWPDKTSFRNCTATVTNRCIEIFQP